MRNNKLLYINNAASSMNGGVICSKRNLESIKSIYGKENVVVYILSLELYVNGSRFFHKYKRIKTILQGYSGNLTKEKENVIFKIIKDLNIDTIFLEYSLMGKLCKSIKKRFSWVKVITFFHNVEIQYIFNQVKTSKLYYRFYWIILNYWNERLSCKYSDKIILLNSRDANLVKKIYGREPEAIIPVSVNDAFDISLIHDQRMQDYPFTILFVGSLFYANVHGIKWFVNNVMQNFPDIILEIVGNDMQKIKSQVERQNVKVYSSVPSLQEYYNHANLVVMPIFTGGGMKVKTAEALMYGKTIIGTPEAFCGYDYNPEIGKICTNKNEFCDAIDYYMKPKSKRFNSFSRDLYLNKYSFNSTLKKFKDVFNNSI